MKNRAEIIKQEVISAREHKKICPIRKISLENWHQFIDYGMPAFNPNESTVSVYSPFGYEYVECPKCKRKIKIRDLDFQELWRWFYSQQGIIPLGIEKEK